jgi:hypothetical protein
MRSLILGEGDNFGVESESERALEGLALDVVLTATAATSRALPFPLALASVAACLALVSAPDAAESPKEPLSIAAITERASPPPKAPGARLRCVSMTLQKAIALRMGACICGEVIRKWMGVAGGAYSKAMAMAQLEVSSREGMRLAAEAIQQPISCTTDGPSCDPASH